jgi:hypothetical protein
MTNQLTQTHYTGTINRLLRIARACTLFYLLSLGETFSQRTTIVDTSSTTHAVVIAGKQYKGRPIHNLFWGSHYRNEWSTPVKVKVLKLDTAFGGLKPIAKGGGRQTHTLRLEIKRESSMFFAQ